MNFTKGSNGNDFIRGTSGQDVIDGGNGSDTIFSFGPDRTIPSIPPLLDARGQVLDQSDLVLGGRGNDLIHAGAGIDYVDGGSGNDTIYGGTGGDWLWGGSGADVFRYNIVFPSPGSPAPDTGVGAGDRDLIWDFKQGTDKIDIAGWQNVAHPGVIFIGQEDPGFNTTLQVGYRYEGANTIVELSRPFFEPPPGSTPGYFGPAGEIELVGHHALTANDFILSA